MSISLGMIEQLESLLSKYYDMDRKTLLFFKGFPADFYLKLRQVLPNSLCEDAWLNPSGYIDVQRSKFKVDGSVAGIIRCGAPLTDRPSISNLIPIGKNA